MLASTVCRPFAASCALVLAAMGLSLGGLAQPALAAPTAKVGQRSFNQGLAITNFMFASAISREAAEAQDERLRGAYFEIDRKRQQVEQLRSQLDQALQQARASSADRRAMERSLQDMRQRYEAEAARYKAEADSWLTEIKRRDLDAKAALQAYEDSLSGIFSANDAETLAIIERYNGGDSTALDDLDAWNRARILEGDKAAQLRDRNRMKADGLRLRQQAIIFEDALDRGTKSPAQVLDVWLRAAERDPDVFWMWESVLLAAADAYNHAEQARAATEMWHRAQSNVERRQAAVQCAQTVELIKPLKACDPDLSAIDHAKLGIAAARRDLATAPQDLDKRFRLVMALDALRARKPILPQDSADIAAAGEEEWQLIQPLASEAADSPAVQRRYARLAVSRPLDWNSQQSVASLRTIVEASVAAARKVRQSRPDRISAAESLASELSGLCSLELNARRFDQVEACFAEREELAAWQYKQDGGSPYASFRWWMVEIDHGLAQLRMGEAGKAVATFTQALKLDEVHGQAGPTLFRLQSAQTANGQIDAARKTLALRLAETVKHPSSVVDNQTGQPISAADLLFERQGEAVMLDWIARDLKRAETGLHGQLASLAAPAPQISDVQSQRGILYSKLAALLVEQGRFAEAAATYRLAEQTLIALYDAQAAPGRVPAVRSQFLRASFQAILADLPQSGTSWADALAAAQAIDVSSTTAPADQQARAVIMKFAELRAQEAVAQGDPRSVALANFKASWHHAFSLHNQDPTNQALVGMYLYYNRYGPSLPGTDFPWSEAAANYISYHQRGWIDPLFLGGNWEFVVGRAAFDKARQPAKMTSGAPAKERAGS